jgi:tetratricopeptide (TPR) repeat protein
LGALEDYNKAIKLNSKNYRMYFNRGSVKHALKDWKGAILDFDISIKLFPCAEAFYCRAKDKINLKNNQGAKQDIIEALRLNPKIDEIMN